MSGPERAETTRRWPVALLALLLAAAAVQGWLWVRLSRSRELAQRHAERLAQMEGLAAELVALRRAAEGEDAEEPADGTEPLSAALVDRIAKAQGVRLDSLNESRSETSGGRKEILVAATAQALSRQELAKLLLGVETDGRGAVARELRMTANTQAPKLVDARIVFAAQE